MKIYTKTGDDGSTGLIGGTRMRKSDPLIECYGTVDELNASLGLAGATENTVALQLNLLPVLREVQADLFVIGSHLAMPADSPHRHSLPALDDKMIARLERQIDMAELELEPLRHFILPGGTDTAARLHLARTVCRRAERLLVEVTWDHPAKAVALIYLNRLSDWLFVHARVANARAGVADIPWVKA